MPIKRDRRALLRRILLLLAIFLGITVALSGCYGRGQAKGWSGATVAGDSILAGSMDGRLVALNKADGSPLWQNNEDAGVLGEEGSKVAIYSTPAVDGDLVYIGVYKIEGNRSSGKVYALVTSTGGIRWVYPREGNLEGPIIGGIAVNQGRLYFGSSDGKVYALDAITGDKIWSFETGDKIWSTPAIKGDTLYITSFDKKLYALNVSDGSKKWEFEIGATFITTPLIYENTVFIGSFDRHVYAVDANDGSLRWRSEVEGGKWFWAKPVIHNNIIYAPNLDGKVYILNAENGSEVASAVALGSPINSAPIVVGDAVIIATEQGKVYSLDTTSQQKRQPIIDVREEIGDIPKNIDRKIYSPLSAENGIVYIKAQTSSEDALYAVNVETQATLWSQSLVISEGD